MVKMYLLYKYIELKFGGKTSEEKYVLALRQNRSFLNICDYFKNMSKAQRFNFTYRAYGKRSRLGSSKIAITNASIDKQITLKRDYIYKIENTDLEIGVSCVLLRILFYFEARRCSRKTGSVYALRINLLNIMIQMTLLRGRGTSIIMKLNESNNEVKCKKKKNLRGLELRTCTINTVNSVP